MGIFDEFWKGVKRPLDDAWKQGKKAVEDVGAWIDKTVADVIPGGWTTVVEVVVALSPAGPLGSAIVGGLSRGTHGFTTSDFDWAAGTAGAYEGWGVGNLTTNVASLATPTPPSTPSALGGVGESAAIKPWDGVGAPPATVPSGLDNITSTIGDNLSKFGSGLENLSGLGPDGYSGIIPTATKLGDATSWQQIAGLGTLALRTATERDQARWENEQARNKGSITNDEYEENIRRIEASAALSKETVDMYPWQKDSQYFQSQNTLYPQSNELTYAQNPEAVYSNELTSAQNPEAVYSNELTSAQNPEAVYSDGGTVNGYAPQDTLMNGNLDNGFNFTMGGQAPMYAKGGWVARYAGGGGISNVVREVEQKKYGLGRYEESDKYARGSEARFLSGEGDGMSDSICANIDGHQEARLADGEFVIPADVVSHLGNGSSKAGAKQLYAMMERVRKVRTGNLNQSKKISPGKFMPA